MPTTAALLLAAGESTRMGELKALLPWHAKPLLVHQVDSLLSAGVSRVIVVLGHQPEKMEPLIAAHPGVESVRNPDYLQGKTTSLKAGLRALVRCRADAAPRLEDAVLILNVDQPRSSETVRCVLNHHRDLITVPTYRGKGGHPVLVSTSLMPELLEISEEDMGLKAVIRRHEDRVQRVEIDSPEILLDLNTPEDYRDALETVVSG